ncbi:class I SAM-dependent methyltransferase [Bradyrhizobium arachidis]|uniref:class I SAM-dependent methyltransferase n=1 Tax=Bradyrhizobium arachidis TaxID=858423 RepID=UPI002163E1C2|nr:class I SAM-dependent methyltransferase [Bradyrhizobium arachidis]UVO30150.1 class I SAM-dependent methyltransferase [Bradyrhizobium arachidis]
MTIPLSRHVEHITAVDRDPQMILQLQKCLSSQGRIEKVDTFVADMRFLKLSSVFDVVVCPRESFQLLVNEIDALHALASFRRHVSKRGCVILDLAAFAQSSEALDDAPEYYSPGLADDEVVADWERRLDDGRTLRRSRSQRVRSPQLLELTFFHTLTSGAVTEEFVSTVELRIYSLSQICDLLKAGGLEVVEAYGNYGKAPISENSARFVILAEAR